MLPPLLASMGTVNPKPQTLKPWFSKIWGVGLGVSSIAMVES